MFNFTEIIILSNILDVTTRMGLSFIVILFNFI